MRIIGRRPTGDICFYEPCSFRFLTDENGERIIKCTLTDTLQLTIRSTERVLEWNEYTTYIDGITKGELWRNSDRYSKNDSNAKYRYLAQKKAEDYAITLFDTGRLDLLDEPVELEVINYNMPVLINSINNELVLPMMQCNK
jgi:hypothetical protein